MAGQKILLLTNASCCLIPRPMADFTIREHLQLDEAICSVGMDCIPSRRDPRLQLAALFTEISRKVSQHNNELGKERILRAHSVIRFILNSLLSCAIITFREFSTAAKGGEGRRSILSRD